MLLRGSYLRINLPDMFEDAAFIAFLNDPKTNIATWHHTATDPTPHSYSDCFVQFDNGEGSDSDMPEKWWNLICEICEEEGFISGILHLTNLQ
jgi:hypothetical protein